MASDPQKAGRPTLAVKLEEESRRLGVDIDGLSLEEVRRAVSEAWLEENREAVESWNEWVRKNGLPLAEYHAF